MARILTVTHGGVGGANHAVACKPYTPAWCLITPDSRAHLRGGARLAGDLRDAARKLDAHAAALGHTFHG